MAEKQLEQPEEAEETEEEPPRLDPETAARRQAALARIRQWGDPSLTTPARPVGDFDEDLRTEVDEMGQLMRDALGVGLAATQLGRLRRLLVYRPGPEAAAVALVNPQFEWRGSEEEAAEEGCLSLAGVLVDVERPVYVRVRARDARGEPLLIEASGFEARVIQHEMDHLDGVLILDRIPRPARKEALRALRETTLAHESRAA